MREPRWLTSVQVRMLHTETLRRFGGLPGLRDLQLLESALARPRQLFSYRDDVDFADLAAAYAFGLARNHAFVDGNKRVSLLTVRAFLFLNGWRFEPDQVETVTVFERLAAGDLDQDGLAVWIRTASSPR